MWSRQPTSPDQFLPKTLAAILLPHDGFRSYLHCCQERFYQDYHHCWRTNFFHHQRNIHLPPPKFIKKHNFLHPPPSTSSRSEETGFWEQTWADLKKHSGDKEPGGVLDLNEPAIEGDNVIEDVSLFHDLQIEVIGSIQRTLSNPDVTKSSEHSKHVSGSNTGASADTNPETGETLSTDDSGGDEDEGEVQSTPCSQTEVKTPFKGKIYDSWEDAKMQYNRYAKKIGFSIKCSTSKVSKIDDQRDKQLFVCNKSGKNEDINKLEAPPVRQRNKSITKKTECKARLRIKRRGTKWYVTYFIEEHNHSLMKKFSLKKYLRSHKGIPKEEKDFVQLLHKVNLSAG
nr:uncharacterized protein LOC127315794 [Lolium perenne]